jgi:glycosyltransferase involved in cell wall biosynthesis
MATIRSWRRFPNSSDPKLWVGADDTLANAFHLYHPFSLTGRCARKVIQIIPDVVARAIFTSRETEARSVELERVRELIRAKLGDSRLTVSFSPGTKGPHQKMTAQVTESGRVAAYVKLATRRPVATLLRREEAMLSYLKHVQFTGVSVPQLLAAEDGPGGALLIVSAPSLPGRRSPAEISDGEVRFLQELRDLERKRLSIGLVWKTLGLTDVPAHGDQAGGAIFRDCRQACEDIFNDDLVEVSCSHGDYAPWNTLTLTDGSLYVFDWEYGTKERPLFADAFHRVFVVERLLKRAAPKEAARQLLNLSEHRVLGPLVQDARVTSKQLQGYALLYLAMLSAREADSPTGVSEYLLQCCRHVLTEVGHAAHPRKVLVAAYACEPGVGSEPGVGWNMCQAISQANEVWVITRANNREKIEQELACAPNPALHFVYVDLPRWARFWKRGQRGIRTYYYLWQFAAWRAARRLCRTVRFDLAHHVTFVNDWLFTFLAFLPVPFVWGPIGSHPAVPSELSSGWSALTSDRLRKYFQGLVRAIDPCFAIAAVRASLIVGIDHSVANRFPLSMLGREKFVAHPAIGVEAMPENAEALGRPTEECRVLSMGRLVPLKGFHLTIRAFARFARSHPKAVLVIVGKGPQRAALEELARTLDVGDRVQFVDWLPRSLALKEMEKAHLFLFPSFEGGGMVVLEALAHGLPVVCLDYGGPGEMVSDECGRVIAIGGNPEDTVRNLAEALKEVCQSPREYARLRSHARKRVAEHYLWNNRWKTVQEWYRFCSRQNPVRTQPGAVPLGTGRRRAATLGGTTLLGILAGVMVCCPVLPLADGLNSWLMQRYKNVAGTYPLTVKGNRGEFYDGHATWTIVGATQENGPPHVRPRDWSVGARAYQLLAVSEAISNEYILPYSDPVPNTSQDPILSIVAARGETEPASFVIRSGDRGLEQVAITIDGLKRAGGTDVLPAAAIDLRLVKSWYQASDSIHRQHGGGKRLVSELLLHDGDLVRVDHQEQVNLIRDVDRLRDADHLLPFDVPARSNQQVWISITVPPETQAGRYDGDVTIATGGGNGRVSAQLKLTVDVLPFRLSEPAINYALYYLAWLNTGQPGLDARAKTTGQLQAEFVDMRAHGLTNIAIDHNYAADRDLRSLSVALERMRGAEFKATNLLYVDWKVTDASDRESYGQKLSAILKAARNFGFTDLYVYNLDEKDARTLLKNRLAFEMAHELGAKNFVAFNSGNLEALSGLLDVAVLPRGTVRTSQVGKNVGIMPWAYGDPQAGEEKPFTYRDRYGISLWVDGFDGACDYAYQTGTFGWDDWADPKWRAHNMTYPTLSHPIPTLQWEGFREGIDDSRYLATAIGADRIRLASSADQRRKLLAEETGVVELSSPRDVRQRLTKIIRERLRS